MLQWTLSLYTGSVAHAVQHAFAGSSKPHLLPVNEKTPSFARKIAKLVPMAANAKKACVSWRLGLHPPLLCKLLSMHMHIN